MAHTNTLAREVAFLFLYQYLFNLQDKNLDISRLDNEELHPYLDSLLLASNQKDGMGPKMTAFTAQNLSQSAPYAKSLLDGVTQNYENLLEKLRPHLRMKIQNLDLINLGTLLLGAQELIYGPEVPFKTVINDQINLAKRFGNAEGGQLVNAVLDKLAKERNSF